MFQKLYVTTIFHLSGINCSVQFYSFNIPLIHKHTLVIEHILKLLNMLFLMIDIEQLWFNSAELLHTDLAGLAYINF